MKLVALWMLCTLCVGCSGVTQGDILGLRAQHELERARLNAVRAQIAQAEMQAALAREQATFEQCRAFCAQIRAEVLVGQAECAKQVAEHNMCEANNSADTAKGGLFGCVLGIGAAALLPGAGLPLALVGCGGGVLAGGASADACTAPACDVDGARLTAAALQRNGRAAAPMCGGYLGVQPTDATLSTVVLAVEAASPAANVGIMANDVIQQVDGVPTNDWYRLYQVMNDKGPGQVVAVSLSRGGAPFVVHVQLASRGLRTTL